MANCGEKCRDCSHLERIGMGYGCYRLAEFLEKSIDFSSEYVPTHENKPACGLFTWLPLEEESLEESMCNRSINWDDVPANLARQ